jgi:hypothetical protein
MFVNIQMLSTYRYRIFITLVRVLFPWLQIKTYSFCQSAGFLFRRRNLNYLAVPALCTYDKSICFNCMIHPDA